MGCVDSHVNRSQSSNLISRNRYISELLQAIEAQQVFSSLLSNRCFQIIHQSFTENFWDEQSQIGLTSLLQDYIKYTLCLISSFQNKTQYSKEKNKKFGRKFGSAFQKINSLVKMKRHWVIGQILFSEKMEKLAFQFEQAQMVSFSEEAKMVCQKNMPAIFYIAAYFMKCCLRLEQQKKMPIVDISKLLKKRATKLKDYFGVQERKLKQNELIKKNDEKQQRQKIEQFEEPYDPVVIKLDQEDKERSLEQEIIRLVQIAKKNSNIFRDLTYSPCIQAQGFGYKYNLKISDINNKGPLLRVKEKLFAEFISKEIIPWDQNKMLEKCQTIAQWRSQEESYVKQLMKNLLKTIQQIPFKVTDLLRGKCLFNKVSHIRAALQKVNERVEACKRAGKNIKLTEIKNRIDKITQDVMIKIQLDQIICQFQFVLSFNKVENQIHHKMYEIVRSKTLSGLSILFDWGEKSMRDFLLDLQVQLRVPFEQQKKKEVQKALKIIKEITNWKQFGQIISEKNIDTKQTSQILKKCVENSKNAEYLLAQKRLRSVQFLYETGKYQQALDYFQAFPKEQTDDELFLKGRAFKQLGRNQEAIKVLEICLAVREKAKGKNCEQYMEALFMAGQISTIVGKYDIALVRNNECLKICQELKGSESQLYGEILSSFGEIHYLMRKNKDSINYYNKALKLFQKLSGKDGSNYVKTLSKIGLVLYGERKYQQSYDCFRRTLEIQQKIYGKDSNQCLSSYNNIGNIYLALKKYDQAADYYLRCKTICEKNENIKDLNYALILNNLGAAYRGSSMLEQALQYYNQSYDIFGRIRGPQSPQNMLNSQIIASIKKQIEKKKVKRSQEKKKMFFVLMAILWFLKSQLFSIQQAKT